MTATRTRGPRRHKSESRRTTAQIGIRALPEQRAEIAAAAEARGLSVSAYVLAAALAFAREDLAERKAAT